MTNEDDSANYPFQFLSVKCGCCNFCLPRFTSFTGLSTHPVSLKKRIQVRVYRANGAAQTLLLFHIIVIKIAIMLLFICTISLFI